MSSQDTIRTADGNTELHGVRGWLLLLCLFLMVVIPLFALLGIIGAWQRAMASPALQPVLISEIVFEIVLAGFAAYAGWALYKLRPNAVRIARIYFLTLLGLSIFGLVALLVSALSQSASEGNAVINTLRGPAAVAGIRQTIISAVCLIYLRRSKRVRATYPVA